MDPEVIQYQGDSVAAEKSAANKESPEGFNLVDLIGSNSETTTLVNRGNRDVAGTGSDGKQTGILSFTSAVFQSAIRTAGGAALEPAIRTAAGAATAAKGAAEVVMEPAIRTAAGVAGGLVGGVAGAALEPAIRTAAGAAGAGLEPTIRNATGAAGAALEPTISNVKEVADLLRNPLLQLSGKGEIQRGTNEPKRTSPADETFRIVKAAKGEFEQYVSPNLNVEQKNYLHDLDAKLQKEHPNMSAYNKHLIKQGMAHVFERDEKGIQDSLKQMGSNIETLKAFAKEVKRQHPGVVIENASTTGAESKRAASQEKNKKAER